MLSRKPSAILPSLILIFVVFLAALSFPVHAHSEESPFKELRQPTGEKFLAEMKESDPLEWAITDKGIVVAKNKKNYWTYAEMSEGKIAFSRKKYLIDPTPHWAMKPEDYFSWTMARNRKGDQQGTFRFPTLDALFSRGRIKAPTHKVLILLVEFTDAKIKTTDNAWSTQFFSLSGSTVNNYYREISGGKFSFDAAHENYGTPNDGVVKVQLNYPHPKPPRNRDLNEQLVEDALMAADPYVDFAAFDMNQDGGLSTDELHIVTIIAGYEKSYAVKSTAQPAVFSHHGNLRPANAVTLDGISLVNPRCDGGYIQHGELHGTRNGEIIEGHMGTIGVLAHEIGHELGLPDLYDTDKSTYGVGPHSLMGSGDWGYIIPGAPGSSPAHPDAWCKIKLGFATPLTIKESGEYEVYSAATGRYNILRIPTTDPLQYFLIENRQFEGYDSSLGNELKNGGIAIWHIDENVIVPSLSVNRNELRRGVDLEEANEGRLGYSQLDLKKDEVYDHYYYLGNNTAFGPGTSPKSILYGPGGSEETGQPSGITVNVPGKPGRVMKVKISLNK